jgi:hypothetical protein
MCRNIKRDWQQQGNTGLRLCKIVRLYPGAPGDPVERKSNLSKKKEKRQIFILFRIATGSISLGTGQKGQSTGK